MRIKENIASRNLDIDAVKGVAIILVVTGHILQFVLYNDTYSSSWVYRFIYSFHMPLFMFISGFLAFKPGVLPNSKWLQKRFVNLVVPFLSWTILNFFILSKFRNETLPSYLFAIVSAPDKGLWFLLVLFYNCLLLFAALKLYGALRKAVKTKTPFQAAFLQAMSFIAVAASVVYVSTFTTFGGIRLCAWQITFYIAGYVLAEFNCYRQGRILDFLRSHTIRKYICACVLLLLFILLCRWWTIDDGGYLFIPFLTGHGVGGIALALLKYMYKYMIPFTGIAAVCMTISALPEPVKRVFGFLGLYTGEIYIMNRLLINSYFGNGCIDAGFSLMLALVIPIMLSFMTRKNRLADTVLFGRYRTSGAPRLGS